MRLLTILLLCTAALPAADTFLIKSANAGRSWTDISADSPDRFLLGLQIDARSSTLYALTQRELADSWHLSTSTDGGQTWQIRQTFPAPVWNLLAARSVSAQPLYLAYEVFGVPQKSVMIARVTNGGETLEQYRAEGLTIDPPQTGLASTYAVLMDLVAAPSSTSTLCAGHQRICRRRLRLLPGVMGQRGWRTDLDAARAAGDSRLRISGSAGRPVRRGGVPGVRQ
jgi:hypothetical protein